MERDGQSDHSFSITVKPVPALMRPKTQSKLIDEESKKSMQSDESGELHYQRTKTQGVLGLHKKKSIIKSANLNKTEDEIKSSKTIRFSQDVDEMGKSNKSSWLTPEKAKPSIKYGLDFMISRSEADSKVMKPERKDKFSPK